MPASKLLCSTPAPAAGRAEPAPIRFLRLRDVSAVVALSRATIYRNIQAGEFPAPVKVGVAASAWIESEILALCASRVALRDNAQERAA